MGVGRRDHAEPVPLRRGVDRAQIPTGIDHQRPAVADTDEVAAVAQTAVDERNHPDHNDPFLEMQLGRLLPRPDQ
jgi:hypothetical protein